MCLIFCLSVILTEFRPLFKYQNFHLFCVFVVGTYQPSRGGDADRYLSSSSSENGLPLTGEVPFPWQVGRRCRSSPSA